MNKPGHREVVGFQFQEIPRSEAEHAVLAGDGSYSEVKQILLEKLPALPQDKAFAFGLPNGKEVPEYQRRGICIAVNTTLNKAKVNWRITYSSSRKLFICVPREQKNQAIRANGYIPKSKRNDKSDVQQIFKLRATGLSAPEIARKTGFALARVQYVVYQLCPEVQKRGNGSSEASNGSPTVDRLIEIAKKVFNLPDDFKTKADFDTKRFRKAISVVGVNDLKLSPKAIGNSIGITGGGVSFNVKNAKIKSFGVSEINALRKAVKQEG